MDTLTTGDAADAPLLTGGYDLLMIVNVSDGDVEEPNFSAATTGAVAGRRLALGGWQSDRLFGGNGPRKLAALAPGDIWVTMIPHALAFNFTLGGNGLRTTSFNGETTFLLDPAAPVPLPSAGGLLLAALLGTGLSRRRGSTRNGIGHDRPDAAPLPV